MFFYCETFRFHWFNAFALQQPTTAVLIMSFKEKEIHIECFSETVNFFPMDVCTHEPWMCLKFCVSRLSIQNAMNGETFFFRVTKAKAEEKMENQLTIVLFFLLYTGNRLSNTALSLASDHIEWTNVLDIVQSVRHRISIYLKNEINFLMLFSPSHSFRLFSSSFLSDPSAMRLLQ